jgi:uncharacterized SAM-dependent methyltransferase
MIDYNTPLSEEKVLACLAGQDESVYPIVSSKLQDEVEREYAHSSIRKKIFNKRETGALAEKVRACTNSNTIGIVKEAQRYKEIADFFARRTNYDRYVPVNVSRLEEVKDKLKAIQREILTGDISELCSKLIERFNREGIIK